LGRRAHQRWARLAIVSPDEVILAQELTVCPSINSTPIRRPLADHRQELFQHGVARHLPQTRTLKA
jgi:hypothetical protein